MSELEQLKQELEKLTKKVKELEKQEEQQENGYPKLGETYYFVSGNYDGAKNIARVGKGQWENDEDDLYIWNFCHGSTDKAKVEWTIKHIELVNEIKKYTRPFEYGEQNWYYETDVDSNRLISDFCTEYFHSSDYDFFANDNDVEKIIKKFGEKYILKILFKPIDGNYKAVMDWLAEQEEE